MLDKSKLEKFSYLSSKWVLKQQRRRATWTMDLAQGLLMSQWKVILRRGESWRWGAIIRTNPLTTTLAAAKELSMEDSTVALHLGAKVKRWKTWQLKKNQKNNSELSSFHWTRNSKPFLGQTVTMWQKDFIWQLIMAYLVDGLRSAKAFPETNLYKKNKQPTTQR